jgi:hypothetical protein
MKIQHYLELSIRIMLLSQILKEKIQKSIEKLLLMLPLERKLLLFQGFISNRKWQRVMKI